MDPHELKPPGPGLLSNSTTNVATTGQQQQLGGSGEQLNLPPPSPQASGTSGINGAIGSLTTVSSASGSVGSCANNVNIFYSNVAASHQQRPSPNNTNNDGDSDTESLASMSAKAKAAAAAEQNHNVSATNGHNCGANTTVNNLSVNAKQQRQQKRRRERAQRLQAERENRFANTVNNIPNSGLLYHASSAGSMGEDSNNSNGNFTSSSNGSNNVMPPTDSIASLLLNPPHSPECNSGLMATPSDSEGESLDEDLLSTSSSSTLLLPRDKPPPRPPPPVRRKLPRSPVLEEEIIDGFAILEFKSYEDLEFAIKLGQKRKEKRLSALEELTCTYSIEETKMPKIIDTGQPHPIRGSGALNLPMNNIKDGSNNIRLHSGNGNSTNCHPAQTVTSSTTVTVQDAPLEVIAPPWKSQYQNSNNNNVGSHITNINQNTLNCSSASGNIINNTSINTAPPTTMILNHNGNNSSNSNNNSDGAGSSSSSSSSGIAETTSSNINNTDEDAVMTSVDATDDCRSVLTAMDSGASSGSSTMAANPISDNSSKSKENNTNNSRTSTVTSDVTNVTSVSSPISTFSVPPPASLVSASASTTILEKCSSSSALANSTTQVIPAQPPALAPAPLSEGYRNAMHLENVKISSNSSTANKSPMDVTFGTNSGANSKSSSHFISMTSNITNATQLGNSNNTSSVEMATDMRGTGSTASAAATVATATQQSAPKIVAQPTPTKDEVFDRIRDAGVTCKSIGMGLNICDNDENKGSERLGPIVFPSTPTQHIANATPSPTTPRKSSDYPQQATGVSIKSENNESFPAPIVSAVSGVGPTVGGVVGVGSGVPGISPVANSQQNKDNVPLGKNSSQTTAHSADGMPPGSSGVHSPMLQAASSSGPPTPVHTVTITNEKPPSGSSAQQQMQQQQHLQQQQHQQQQQQHQQQQQQHQQQQQQHQQLHSPQQQPTVAGVQLQPNLPPPFSTPTHQVSTETRNLVPSSPATQHIDSPFVPKLATNPVGAHLVTSPINASIHGKNLPPTQGNGAQSTVAPISMMPAPITTTVASSPAIGGFGVNSRLGPAPPMHHLQSGFSSVPATNSSVGVKPIDVTGTSEVPIPKSIAAPPPVMNGFLPGFMPGSASAQNSVRISPHMGHMAPVASGMPPISVVPLTSVSTAPATSIPGSVTNSNVTMSLPVTVAASSASMTPVTMSSMPKGPYVVSATPASTMSSSAAAPSHGMFVQANPAIALPGAPPMLGGVPNGIAPMLIHSPYRTPYPGYPLYAPYSGLPHSPYLPPAVPSPNASPRTIDTRTGREITPLAPSPKVISTGMRPVTPVSSSTPASVAPVSCSGGTTIAAPPPPATLASVQMPMSGLPPGSVPGPGLPPGQQTTHLLHHLPYGANPHGPPQSVPSSAGFPMSIGAPNNSHIYSSGANSSGNNTNTTTTASMANATALSGNSNNSGNSNSGGHSSGSAGSMGGGNSTIQLQRGDSSHLLPPPPPHMLSHPNLPPPPSHVAGGPHMAPIPHMLMHPQHGMLRGISPSTANANSSNNSALPLIGGPTSSSVIQRVISPKSENPNRERDIAYSIPRSAPSINTHSSASNSTPTGAPPYMTTAVSSSSVGSAMPVPYSSSTVSALHTMHSHPATTMASPHQQHIATPPSLPYPPKNPLWPSSSPLQLTPSTTATNSTSSSASLATRPTPPPAPPQSTLNVVGASAASSAAAVAASMPANSASPQTTHSATGAVSTFQPSFFITPLPPPPPTVSASAMSSSATTPSSTSMAVSSGAGTIAGAAVSAPIGAATSSSSVSASQTTVTTATSTPVTTAAPHPFSAESLFQTSKNDQADLLRRELDSRFLDRSGLAVQPPAQPPPPSTYLRQELHHHQHQHTHLHQHQQLIPAAMPASLPAAPPPAPAPIFPQLFKDIPKIAAVDTPFYRTGIGLPGYPGYNSGLLHPGLGGATPFMPPGHLTSFAPKPPPPSSPSANANATNSNNPPTNLDSSKSARFTKTGRWNAMHVRIAWEIYYNQNKQNPDKLTNTQLGVAGGNPVGVAQGGATSSLSAAGSVGSSPSSSVTLSGLKTSPALSLSSASPHMLHRPGELPPGAMAAYAGALPGRSPFETSPLSTSFIGAPPSHIGTAVSPYGRYAAPFGFGLSHFGCETWRPLQRAVPYHPGPTSAPMWPLKPDPALDNARREAEEREREREREREMREREQRERERQRREREERERKEKEEKMKREQQERERERERKERERRELERRELERERMLQQQRINESNKLSQAAAAAAAMNSTPRDRSPHRNHNDPLGGPSVGEIRIKEEHPRTKEEQDAILSMRASAAAAAAGDARYHQSIAVAQASAAAAAHHASFMAGRHGPHGVGPPPPPHLARSMMPQALGGPPMSHFGPPGPPGWPMDPYRDPYAPMLRYNIMEALRHEEERHKVALSMYAAQSAAHLRGKEPSPIPPPSVGGPLGPPPPPPHHRIQQSPHHQQAGGVAPPPTIIGKPPTLGGMPHPIAVDGHHPTKKEDGSPNVGVSGMQTAPSPSAPGR